MTIELSHIIPIIIFTLGFVVQYFTVISDLKTRIANAELKINVWWSAVEKKFASGIMAPTHYYMDALLTRYQTAGPDSLEMHELETLLHLVQRRTEETRESDPSVAAQARGLEAFIEARIEERRLREEQERAYQQKPFPMCLAWCVKHWGLCSTWITERWKTCGFCQQLWTGLRHIWNWLRRA